MLSLFPFIYIVLMSLSRVGLIGGIDLHWAGLDNWTRLFSDSTVGAAWIRSIVYFFLTVGLEMLLGIAFALLVHSLVLGPQPRRLAAADADVHGAGDRRPARPLPHRLDVRAVRLVPARDPHLHGRHPRLPTSAFIAVTLMDVWEWTPLIALIVLAGLSSLPGPVLEAARVDGASSTRKRLRYIVMPMIMGVVIVALLVRSMDAIRYLDIIYTTTNGGPADATKIVPIRLYETAFRFFDLGYGGGRPVDAGGLDPGREPVHAHPQAAGLAK